MLNYYLCKDTNYNWIIAVKTILGNLEMSNISAVAMSSAYGLVSAGLTSRYQLQPRAGF